MSSAPVIRSGRRRTLAAAVAFALLTFMAILQANAENNGSVVKAEKQKTAVDSDMYGLCAGTNYSAKSLDSIKGSHIRWLRKGLSWNRVEKVQGHYDWSDYDRFVDEAKARGYKIMAILLDTAPWATRDKSLANTKTAHKQPPDPQLWKSFVDAAVNHYRGRIDAWEVGNEPNGPSFFLGSLPDYREIMLKGGAEVIRKDTPNATIVGPALACSKAFREGKLQSKFNQVLAEHGGDSVDVISIHFYGTPQEIIDAGQQTREIMNKAGLGKKPLWLTEFGWNTTNISENEQKMKFQNFLALNEQTHTYDKFFYYRLKDGGKTLTGKRADWHGLLREDGSAKPILSAF